MIPGDLLSAFPHRQFHTLPGLLDSWAATLKLKYRKRPLRHVLMQLSAGKTSQEIVDSVNVLDACHWISTSMNDIQPSTIIKCFAKCGMKESLDVADPDTDDDDDVTLARLIEQLRDHDIPQSLSEQHYVNIDADVPVNHSVAPAWENRLVDDFVMEQQRTDTVQCDSETVTSRDTSDYKRGS